MHRLIVVNPSLRRLFAFSPLLLFVIIGFASLFAYLELRSSRDAVGRSREARLAAEEVISDLKDAETGQRGFLLLGEETYLKPYEQALRALTRDTARLRHYYASASASQRARLALLRKHIGQRLAIIDSTIDLRRAGQLQAAEALVRAGQGALHMNAIRDLVAEMDAEEAATLNAQLAREERSAIALITIFALGLLIVVPFGLMVSRAVLHYTEDRDRWLKKVEAQNEMLHAQSAELEAQRDSLQDQAVELEAQHSELEMQNDELQSANEALELARIQAEQANAAKSAFLTSMSHELRTPLNAIAGYTDLIEAGVFGPASDRMLDAVRRIHINEEQLLSVINQILDYTGIKSRTQPMSLEAVDIKRLMESVEAIVAPMLLSKGLSYSVAYEGSEPRHVVSHADRLRQILINLVSNAAKFTTSPGAIVVSCARVGERVEIAVRDTGVGIAADYLERIFEPFVQLGTSLSASTEGGVGLGLAISRELVRAMGGEITVQSKPGVGSVFTISLPVAVVAARENASAALKPTVTA